MINRNDKDGKSSKKRIFNNLPIKNINIVKKITASAQIIFKAIRLGTSSSSSVCIIAFSYDKNNMLVTIIETLEIIPQIP